MEQFNPIFTKINSKQETFNNNNINMNLKRSHFILGNDETQTSFETVFKKDYYDKSKFTQGNDYAYKRENNNNMKNIFERDKVNWVTSQQISYTPKKIESKVLYTRHLPHLRATNKLNISSINQELLNKKPHDKFVLGTDNYSSQLTTVNQQTYRTPKINSVMNFNKHLDIQSLHQKSNWSLGVNNNIPSQDHFISTYGKTMTPKKQITSKKVVPLSTIQIKGYDPCSYSTEFTSSYLPVINKISPEEYNSMQNIIKNIRSSHFNFGESQLDYCTTMENDYKYEVEKANKARMSNINDLQYKNSNTKGSQIRIGHYDNAKIEGKTIYMTDYASQQLPIIEEK